MLRILRKITRKDLENMSRNDTLTTVPYRNGDIMQVAYIKKVSAPSEFPVKYVYDIHIIDMDDLYSATHRMKLKDEVLGFFERCDETDEYNTYRM